MILPLLFTLAVEFVLGELLVVVAVVVVVIGCMYPLTTEFLNNG